MLKIWALVFVPISKVCLLILVSFFICSLFFCVQIQVLQIYVDVFAYP